MKFINCAIALTLLLSAFLVISPLIAWSDDQTETVAPAAAEPEQQPELIGSSVCIACHDKTVPKSPRSHIAIFDKDNENPNYGYGCEACHGPGSNHNGDPEKIIMPSKLKHDEIAKLCSKCHSSLGSFNLKNWYLSTHYFSEMDCLNCHKGHSENEKFLIKPKITELCYSCHSGQRAELNMRSHHPVNEDQLSCTSCHNQHSGAFDKQLKNEPDKLCFECHGDKEGPFTFDHDVTMAAGGEGCLTCHFVHGSNTDNLLRYPNRLCLRCHSDMNRNNHFTGTCWASECHHDIHGSYTSPLFFSAE